MREMLRAILERLAAHPSDRVDLEMHAWREYVFLSIAAFQGVLSVLYPLVKGQPYYVNAARPLVLRMKPVDMDE